jgi:hypothetical protein
MKILRSTALFVIGILFFACNGRNELKELDNLSRKEITEENTRVKEEEKTDFGKFYADSAGSPQNPGNKKEKKQQVQQQTVNPDWDKKIIKTASVNLEVKDYSNFYTSLREKVRNMGGYIAQEEQSQSDYKIENTMTIKVPVD